MVIHDFSINEVSQINTRKPYPYFDRIIACVIDLLILTPVISLFTATINADLRWDLFAGSDGTIFLLMGSYALVMGFIFLLYEILFLYIQEATVGHQFLGLQIIGFDLNSDKFLRIFFRSFFKLSCFFLVGLPFLEILIRSDRSMFYDRLSGLSVKSKKTVFENDLKPEFKYLLNRIVYLFVFLTIVLVAGQFVRLNLHPEKNLFVKSKSSCSGSLLDLSERVLLKNDVQKNLKCLDLKSQEVSINSTKIDGQYYFSQVILNNEDSVKEKYKRKLCEFEKWNRLCGSFSYSETDFDSKDRIHLFSALIELEKVVKTNQYEKAFWILDQIHDHVVWNEKLELIYMTSFLKISDDKTRAPASATILSNFQTMKKRFMERIGE